MMDVIKVLLITLLAAVGGGALLGIIWGKQALKRATSGSRPLLSPKERILYAGILMAGVACILIGVFLAPSSDSGEFAQDDMYFGEEGGDFQEGFDDDFTEEEAFTEGEADGEDALTHENLSPGEAAEDEESGEEVADGIATAEEEAVDGGETAVDAGSVDHPVMAGSSRATSPSGGAAREVMEYVVIG